MSTMFLRKSPNGRCLVLLDTDPVHSPGLERRSQAVAVHELLIFLHVYVIAALDVREMSEGQGLYLIDPAWGQLPCVGGIRSFKLPHLWHVCVREDARVGLDICAGYLQVGECCLELIQVWNSPVRMLRGSSWLLSSSSPSSHQEMPSLSGIMLILPTSFFGHVCFVSPTDQTKKSWSARVVVRA